MMPASSGRCAFRASASHCIIPKWSWIPSPRQCQQRQSPFKPHFQQREADAMSARLRMEQGGRPAGTNPTCPGPAGRLVSGQNTTSTIHGRPKVSAFAQNSQNSRPPKHFKNCSWILEANSNSFWRVSFVFCLKTGHLGGPAYTHREFGVRPF